MAVQVGLRASDDERFEEAGNFTVDPLGNLFVERWDGIGWTNLAVFVSSSWLNATVLPAAKS